MNAKLVILFVASAIAQVAARYSCPIAACPFNYDPVCGSNNQTYSNECLLRMAACSDPKIKLAYKGACKPVCHDKPCPKIYDPVCASDGHTYGNMCLFLNAKCKKPSLTVVVKGVCDPR